MHELDDMCKKYDYKITIKYNIYEWMSKLSHNYAHTNYSQ